MSKDFRCESISAFHNFSSYFIVSYSLTVLRIFARLLSFFSDNFWDAFMWLGCDYFVICSGVSYSSLWNNFSFDSCFFNLLLLIVRATICCLTMIIGYLACLWLLLFSNAIWMRFSLKLFMSPTIYFLILLKSSMHYSWRYTHWMLLLGSMALSILISALICTATFFLIKAFQDGFVWYQCFFK